MLKIIHTRFTNIELMYVIQLSSEETRSSDIQIFFMYDLKVS